MPLRLLRKGMDFVFGATEHDSVTAGAVDAGAVDTGDVRYRQRGAPTTAELADGERMTYVSDGTDGNAAGDLVSARNNAGTIVGQVIVAAVNDV